MCLECSGRHRALGVHISFVRSVSMDSWTPKQIEMMANGGNAACNTFLKKYNVSSGTHSISQKYNSPAASLYRARLSAIVEKRDPPTELPSDHPDMGGSGGDDHGSDPLPGETEEAYVARQRKLQEQVGILFAFEKNPVLTMYVYKGAGANETKVWQFIWVVFLWRRRAYARHWF